MIGAVVNASLDLGPIKAKYNKEFALGGYIQRFIDSTVLNGVEPYVPMKMGDLTKSGISHSRIGYGQLIWKGPQARYLWYGKVMEGAAPMRVTDRDLNFNQRRHPLAGKMWATRYKVDHLTELREMVAKKVANI